MKNLKCKSHEMLKGPIEEDHPMYQCDFQEEISLQENSVFLEGRGLDQVISQCSVT